MKGILTIFIICVPYTVGLLQGHQIIPDDFRIIVGFLVGLIGAKALQIYGEL